MVSVVMKSNEKKSLNLYISLFYQNFPYPNIYLDFIDPARTFVARLVIFLISNWGVSLLVFAVKSLNFLGFDKKTIIDQWEGTFFRNGLRSNCF